MKINGGYQRYRGTPRELRSGYGYTRDGLWCVRVRVRYGKIPPAVYPCSTLLTSRTGNSWARRSHSSFDSLNWASRAPRERLCCSITVRSFKASRNRRAHSSMDAVLFQQVEMSWPMRSGLILAALHCSSRSARILGLLKMRFARLCI